MKHGFLITAYTDAKQLLDLVDSLDSPDSAFYIHLDAKSSLYHSGGLTHLKNRANVFFVEPSVRVFWGGFSHVRAILLLLQEAVKNRQTGYVHLLSGQCYPLRSFAEFTKFFEDNKGTEFITCAPIGQMNWSGGSLNRLQLYHLNDLFNIRKRFWKRINSRFLQLQKKLGLKRKLPVLFEAYYGGGTWWSLSGEAAACIVQTFKTNPALLPALRHTHCAEEIIFHTILANSSFRDKIVSDDLRYVDWSTRDGICPVILDERDLDAVRKSNKLIGRKFMSGKSDKLKELLSR